MTDEQQIRNLIECWAAAVHDGDLPAVLAGHAPDIAVDSNGPRAVPPGGRSVLAQLQRLHPVLVHPHAVSISNCTGACAAWQTANQAALIQTPVRPCNGPIEPAHSPGRVLNGGLDEGIIVGSAGAG